MTVREKIIVSAQELIYHQGYVGTSISDIMTAAGVGKGQLYHYFTSKKQIGLEATQLILDQWRQELLVDIFASDLSASDKVDAMLDWFYQFHTQQKQTTSVLYGCPVGNLIVELSAQDQEFRRLLQQFMADWQSDLAVVLKEIKADWSEEDAARIIATLQGSVILMKVSQNIAVLKQTIEDLKASYHG